MEFLVAETYNWFSRISASQNQYRSIFNAINDGHDPLKIVRACQTRWLSVETALSRIIKQYLELEIHFKLARMTDQCFMANQLYEIYADRKLKSYLYFVQPHLQAVQRVNKLFQGSSTTDMSKLFNELCYLIEETANVITNKRRDFDPMTSTIEDYLTPNPYLGYEFESHNAELLKERVMTAAEASIVRSTCVTFIVNLVKSLRLRLPDNIKILRQIDVIAVDRALRVVKPSFTPILEELRMDRATITRIELQWKHLVLVSWTKKDDTACFWAEVKSFKDAGGNNPFKDLSDFACKMLCLPFSNAEVERIFSQMNLVKTKLRNRMQSDMVNAILMIRSSMSNSGSCCSNFQITPEMVSGIGTTAIYQRESADSVED